MKLTIEGHWSWWRVLLPLWVVLGHNALYIGVGLLWLFFSDDSAGEGVTISQRQRPYGYQFAAMLCSVVFADSLLGRIEGQEQTMWFWMSSVQWEVIFLSGILSVVCQVLFWFSVVRPGHHGTRSQ